MWRGVYDVEDVEDGDSDIGIRSADGTANNGGTDSKKKETEAILALRLQLELKKMKARVEKEWEIEKNAECFSQIQVAEALLGSTVALGRR